MGYLYFYSETINRKGEKESCSRPLWGIYISIRYTSFCYCDISLVQVLVPYGVSIFLFSNTTLLSTNCHLFSSPMGYLYFYSILQLLMIIVQFGSRPLWGIYISIPCPRYPLFVKGLFSTLRCKIFF